MILIIQGNNENQILKIDSLIKEADNLFKQNEFDKTMDICKKIFIASKSLEYQKGQAESLRLIGTIQSIKAQNDAARETLMQAKAIYDEIDDSFGNIKTTTNLGIVLGNLGLLQDSLKHFLKAIELTVQLKDLQLLSEQYVNIGSVYRKLNNLGKSVTYYKKAIIIRKKMQDVNGLGSIYNNIGNIYEMNHDYGIALGYFYKALEIWNKTNFKRGITVVSSNIGTIYKSLKKTDKAIEQFEKVLFLSLELGIVNLQSNSYTNLAELFIEKKLYKQAKDYLMDAERINLLGQDSEVKKFIINSYVKLYSEMEDYKNAFEYQKILSKIKEEIFSENYTKKISSMEYDFNLKQREKETELYKLKNVELAKANEEIEKKSKELAEINESLKQLHKSKDAILSIVSHDLKNLIGSIYSIIDLLRFEVLSEKTESYLNMIDNTTQKALQLVKDILEANAIETSNFKLKLEPFNLKEILSSFVYSFKLNSETKKIDLKVCLSKDNVIVFIQQDRFWQIFNNLIHNAIKFTNTGGNITISTEIVYDKEKVFAFIKISDTGIGIPEDLLPIIFDKFTKAKRKGTQGESTVGLGLSIVKRLVELHNGEIFVKSIVNTGTEFVIKLPAEIVN